MFGPLGNSQPPVVVILVRQAVAAPGDDARNTLGGDLATVPGHKARRRQGAAAVPPHQIVSPSLSQSESPVAVDLRIHARNDGQPLARAPMVHAGRRAEQYACQSSPRRRRRAGRNRRGNSASTSRRSEAAPIRTRFSNRRHGVRPHDSQVSKTGLRLDHIRPGDFQHQIVRLSESALSRASLRHGGQRVHVEAYVADHCLRRLHCAGKGPTGVASEGAEFARSTHSSEPQQTIAKGGTKTFPGADLIGSPRTTPHRPGRHFSSCEPRSYRRILGRRQLERDQ